HAPNFTGEGPARYVFIMNLLRSNSTMLKRTLFISSLVLLTACGRTAPSLDAAYSDGYSRNMFDTGYSFISDRYIKPVSLRELSLNGLSGLHQLDSNLDVQDTAGRIEVL
ncbi:unnamed protein product, partial [Laminaria digitata]